MYQSNRCKIESFKHNGKHGVHSLGNQFKITSKSFISGSQTRWFHSTDEEARQTSREPGLVKDFG